MMIMGVNLLIGGLIVTVVSLGELSLLPFTAQPLTPSTTIGSILTLVGFILLAGGFILAIHYDRQRSWYVHETAKSTTYKKKPKPRTVLDELAEQRKS